MIRTLLLDIETAPHVAYIWRLYDDYVPIDRVITSGYTLCWAAKWHGDKTIMFDSTHKSSARKMIRRIHGLLDEADAVVHYNGKKFDLPILQQEFTQLEMRPPSPARQIDLLETTRKKFRFASNKLDFVVQRLGLGAKVPNKGMELWTGCMSGDEKSWKEMERYNRGDVVILERLYDKLLPWIDNHPNASLYSDTDKPTCPNCGSTNLQRRGIARTNVSIYARFQCKNCGAWARGRSNQLPKELQSSVLARATG